MIKAVFYDMGDIFFEAHLWRKWMYEKLSAMNLFNGSFKDFYEYYESILLPVYQDKLKYEEAYDNFLTELEVPNAKVFKEESFRMKLFFEENRELYDGVAETLKVLQLNGISNIVITDNEQGEAGIRKNILEKFEINDFIERVFSSKEFGLTKPDPEIFRLALLEFNLHTNQVLFVGHDKEEIDGAEGLGIKAVEYNNYLGYRTKATFRMTKFKDLSKLIAALNYE